MPENLQIRKESTDLESKLRSYYQKYEPPVKRALKNYIVDVTASWTFYTPIMAEVECFFVGLEPYQIGYSRASAAAIGAITMRPYGKFRNWWKKKWHVTAKSSQRKNFLVDTSAMLIFQIPTYSTILYFFADASPKQIALALPTAAIIGVFSGRPYGAFLDTWRDFWNSPAQSPTDHYARVFTNHNYYVWRNGERIF